MMTKRQAVEVEAVQKPWAGEFAVDTPDTCVDCGSIDRVDVVSDDTGTYCLCEACIAAQSAEPATAAEEQPAKVFCLRWHEHADLEAAGACSDAYRLVEQTRAAIYSAPGMKTRRGAEQRLRRAGLEVGARRVHVIERTDGLFVPAVVLVADDMWRACGLANAGVLVLGGDADPKAVR